MELEKEIHVVCRLLHIMSLMMKCCKIHSLLSKITFVVSRANSELSRQRRKLGCLNLNLFQGLTVVLIDEIA
jgi:hypothetical protein